MTATRLMVGIVLCVAVLAGMPARADRPVPVANPGFEEAGRDAGPGGWVAPEAATLDRQAAHGGGASLKLTAPTPASLVVESEPVTLAVGRLYRVSAWLRTEGALADPFARYPTAVPAAVTMASFPFTNHSPAVGGTRSWTRVESLFIATRKKDAVRLHLGLNGTATGSAWFDDVSVEEVDDIAQWIPLETVRWAGEGYRYDDRGWIFVHVEGRPYERGRQYGELVAEEIAEYIKKLSISESAKDPAGGWAALRLLADATMLRGFDEEYLTEMRGIADGAAKAGAKVEGRPVDLLDIVTVNSAVDIGQLRGALRATPHALSGRSFLAAEDELAVPDRTHKCSAFVATGPATADGRVVFGQIFMWAGYTGVHFNILLDVDPADGHRLVYQTFPGGIHSGTDFYMNKAGIVFGETTVAQTPFDASGTPQSNRARKAAQYASSIDDVVRILSQRNNGLYTNDWPIANVKTDEGAIFLLGTHANRLWRADDTPSPFGTPGFLWSNNNARDPEVRKEYAANPDNAPFDLAFSPWNRDIAFNEFYQAFKGKIDAAAAVGLWASSPTNRPHACDGKVTTSEMAEQLVFLAHFGKVTLREKFPQAGSRRMPDLPGALPHLTLGYSTPSPIFVTDKLKAARAAAAGPAATEPKLDLEGIKDRYKLDARGLWHNTVYPATDGDNWLVSGSAAYWQILHGLPEDPAKAARSLRDQLAELDNRLLWVLAREDDVVATDAQRVYDRYGHYQIPRIKGTFLLHQLRLLLGNQKYLEVMNAVHDRFAARELSTGRFTRVASEVAGRDLGAFVGQWVERGGLPDPQVAASLRPAGSGWTLVLEVTQPGEPYHLLSAVEVEVGGTRVVRPLEITEARQNFELAFVERPTRVVFDPLRDLPVRHDRFYTWANWSDDFQRSLIVHGTARQVEANRTLALRFQATLGDAFSELLPPVVKDCEASDAELSRHDVIVLGGLEDNTVLARLAGGLPVRLGKNWFAWQGKTYARSDDGLFLALPNPANPERALYLFLANSALQLHEMTKSYPTGLASWAVYRGAEVKEQGAHPVARFALDVR